MPAMRNEHVLAVVIICALSDAILIALGVASFGKIALRAPWLDPVMRYGGACFLAWYGAKSLNSALRSTLALTPERSAERAALMPVMLACLALTWLNPHVYLDTVGRPARGDLDPISRLRSFLCGRRHFRVVPFLLLARLRRKMAGADFRKAIGLADVRGEHRPGHVVDLIQARRKRLMRFPTKGRCARCCGRCRHTTSASSSTCTPLGLSTGRRCRNCRGVRSLASGRHRRGCFVR